ncbi:MAG: hypothetical protein CO144_00245 [Candidatus Nealsonbacteria bacterium CG_4_9_14_3_um_filter_35_11]|uniref:SHSP domain-containing protein n=2 Tax=Candidatus Nealsoniibacteriota TaxID=1817911 RepID=A0A2M7DAW0_9BACT|nr:MAG: hypothetical protein COV62_00240 [Candidatus Nealsonbacteria bacterium CG11_big_fil_rev_8_21_14_0_20_35_11]PIV45583.1 MAG: hypothetical protein COS24_01565 [Candidatus Nealsonbacteria bacterium CG02_land_8_20_14_3_00_34_20]PIW92610.1 MAG: hypothetical protein COZ88_01335 [Candidatus Nealsonbacteria bacterium CG_4_8_14_3_um_filter_34_13]PIZ89918.1 MAG: hypothetical protein COX88_01260 [Candidatus Nealsonbacteria bacterium CG_4_10_14_0_2_um_filter_35_20]PJA84860.1 MAG: hypothetical protei
MNMAFLEKLKKNQKKEILENKSSEEKRDWKISEGQLSADIYETETELIIQTAIAGVQAKELDISLENDVLIIKGERENPTKDSKKNYFSKECYFGPFSREVILPREIDPSRVKATMEEGILTIRMPKIEREKKKKIIIEG